jgi:hypothetical protein
MLLSLLNYLTTDRLQTLKQVTSKCAVYFLLPLGSVNFPIQSDFLNATYYEYVLFQGPGSCSVLRALYENHEAVSQEFL